MSDEEKHGPSQNNEKVTVTCMKCKADIEIEPPGVKRPPVKKSFFQKIIDSGLAEGAETYYCQKCGTAVKVNPEHLYLVKRLGIDPDKTEVIRCPKCKTVITVDKQEAKDAGGRLEIRCSKCNALLLFKSSRYS
jgi:predicted Zn finger-like uncharacterized protein